MVARSRRWVRVFYCFRCCAAGRRCSMIIASARMKMGQVPTLRHMFANIMSFGAATYTFLVTPPISENFSISMPFSMTLMSFIQAFVSSPSFRSHKPPHIRVASSLILPPYFRLRTLLSSAVGRAAPRSDTRTQPLACLASISFDWLRASDAGRFGQPMPWDGVTYLLFRRMLSFAR